jgi:hypothetical protein
MTFLRYSVPGVLGDWHWRRQGDVAADLLRLRRATGRDDLLLLDLARLRWLRASDDGHGLPFERTVSGLDTEPFRALLARRESPEPGDDPARLASSIGAQLATGRAAFAGETGFLGEDGLARWRAALEPGAALLDFDLSGTRTLALVADESGVTRVDLGPSSRHRDWPARFAGLPTATAGEFTAAMRGAGRLWLEPLQARLPGRVYLAFGDGLSGLPFEAFEVGSAPFAAERSVIRLASFPARPGPAQRLGALSPERVFLAGAPVDFSPGFLDQLQTGAELRAVMDRFRGPGLQVIQGSALEPEEFTTEAFRAADLVHLAQPARIDFQRPENAWLEFSEPAAGAGRLRLPARELARLPSSAALTVFSQSVQPPVAGGSGRPPLVSGTLAAGSGAVITTAWSGEESQSAAFFAAYYDAVAGGRSLDDAFRAAVRARRTEGTDWARYRLWVD